MGECNPDAESDAEQFLAKYQGPNSVTLSRGVWRCEIGWNESLGGRVRGRSVICEGPIKSKAVAQALAEATKQGCSFSPVRA